MIHQILISLISITATYLGVYFSLHSKRYDSAMLRLQNVYTPLFSFCEPLLYSPQKLTSSYVRDFLYLFDKLNQQHYEYINPELRKAVTLFSQRFILPPIDKTPPDKYWNFICLSIERDYDKLCQRVHLPIRSFPYRKSKKQFLDSSRKISCAIKEYTAPFLLWFFTFLAFFLIFSLLLG